MSRLAESGYMVGCNPVAINGEKSEIECNPVGFNRLFAGRTY